VSARSVTVFYSDDSFTDALNQLDVSVVAAVNVHLVRFENAWKASKHDGEIPAGFYLEAYHDVDGPYQLYQIRVGPRHGCRVVVMFLDGGSDAYWVHIFQKVKNRQPEDMKRAHLYAQRLWAKLQRRNDHETR
jgi:hypothetical protein